MGNDSNLHREKPETTDLQAAKLELEIAKLRSEITRLGTFARLSWPIVSTAMSIILGVFSLTILFFTYRTQQLQADLKRQEIFFTALHDATDGTKTADLRISGLWALSQFWEPAYDTIVANALGAVLATDSPRDDPGSSQRIRLTAAEVMGTAISAMPGDAFSFSVSEVQRAERMAAILYGNGETGAGGVIARVQGDLLSHIGRDGFDQGVISQKLQAAREGIRKNWKWLRNVYLHGHNLTDIRLYEADLTDADLGEATVTRGNFCKANLYNAVLDRIQDWGEIDVRLANIKKVRAAPNGFRRFALDHGAVEMDPAAWIQMVRSRKDLNCLVAARKVR